MTDQSLSVAALSAVFAYLPPGTPTLAEAIDQIVSDDQLAPTRRRDLRSALTAMAKAVGRPPEQVPASHRWLRNRLEGFHPHHMDFSAKRWSNIKSDVSFAFRHLGLVDAKRPHLAPFLPQWQALMDRIYVDRMRWNLSRFMHFCSAVGVGPDAVSDAVMDRFRFSLVEESFVKNPDWTTKYAVKLWNQAVDTIPDWPQQRLTTTNDRKDYALPFATFPASFQADVDHFIVRVSGHDLMAEDGPLRPFAPDTIRHRQAQIRRFATALVERGHAIDAIVDLGYLVKLDHFRDALRFHLDRNGGQTSGAIHGLARTMISIAAHHSKVDAEQLTELKKIGRRLATERGGLSEQNRERLRQFDDDRSIGLLLTMPRRLMAEADRRPKGDRQAAVLAQIAVAVELLLMCPIRLRNLASLRIDRHFHFSRSARNGVCHLVIDRTEVKNRQDLEVELLADSVKLLRRYLDHYQTRLAPVANSFLFPGRTGQTHKRQHILSQQISKHVFRLTGLAVNTHLFRHIAAKLYLDAHPGAYEVVRRVLGHKSMETTTQAYTGLESMAAARHFDNEILALRDRTGFAGRRLRRRKKPKVEQ